MLLLKRRVAAQDLLPSSPLGESVQNVRHQHARPFDAELAMANLGIADKVVAPVNHQATSAGEWDLLWLLLRLLHSAARRPALLGSMHAPVVGNILAGLQRFSGLNAVRSRSIIFRSSGLNNCGIKSIFSTPM